MRLLHCHIENFGKLHQEEFDLSSGFNVFLEENGWGKSTLASFIKVMFYGFENERSRDDYQNERKRFRPWQGGIYGGSIIFEAGGKEYLLERTFGMKEKEDMFSLRAVDTNLETRDFSSNLGEELFQIDRASFARTVFLSQNDCETYATDGIHAKLGNLAENTDDRYNYEKVDSKLNDFLNSMSPTRKTGVLFKKKEEISYLEMEVKMGSQIEDALSHLEQEKKAQESRYHTLKMQQRYGTLLEQYQMRKREKEEKRRYFPKEVPEEADVRRQLELCSKWMAEEKFLSMHEKDLVDNKYDEVVKNPIEMKKIFGIVLCIVGILLSFRFLLPGISCVVLGALLLLVKKSFKNDDGELEEKKKIKQKENRNAPMVKRAKENCRNIKQNLEMFLETYGFSMESDVHGQFLKILDHLQQLQYVSFEFQKICNAIDQFEASDEVDDIDTLILPDDFNLNQMIDSLEQSNQSLLNIERKIEELQQKRIELEAKEAKLLELQEEYEKLSQKYNLLQKTREHLRMAKTSLTAKYTNPLKIGFAKYYEMLTGERAEHFYLDADMNFTLREQGMQRESRFLSAGYRDLIGICMRMALLDTMYQKEKPFLIFDDPFVNLDGAKTNAGLEFLRNISKEYQVIYFTCHESRK